MGEKIRKSSTWKKKEKSHESNNVQRKEGMKRGRQERGKKERWKPNKEKHRTRKEQIFQEMGKGLVRWIKGK